MKVSVRLMTYNHKDYIEEALQSIDNQITNFNFEVVIGDDFSPDNTLLKIKNYKFLNPRLSVHILDRKKGDAYDVLRQKKGRLINFIDILNHCTGKYIALLDGDDYWTDPLKLQKQVDFLEANEDYNICSHQVELYNETKMEFKKDTITRFVNESTDVLELVKGNYIHTPSVVLRNNFTIPKWFCKSPIGDWPLYMIAIKDKKIKKLDDVMAVYRTEGLSIWSNKTREFKILKTLKAYELVHNSNGVNNRVKKELKKKIKNLKNQIKKKDSKFVMVFKKIKKKLFL